MTKHSEVIDLVREIPSAWYYADAINDTSGTAVRDVSPAYTQCSVHYSVFTSCPQCKWTPGPGLGKLVVLVVLIEG